MRIGIMTFWWSQDNYGQLLQCYALQKYLSDLGHEPYLIRFYQDSRRLNFKQKFVKYGLRPWRILDGIARVVARRKGKKLLVEHPRGFDEFRAKFLKFSDGYYTTHDELKGNPPPADMYIVGSDQVWNVNDAYLPGDVNAYYLDFGKPNIRRVAYAASFGRSSIPMKEANRIGPLLKNFDAVSVREKSGVDICSRIGVKAEWVCDPTLLLSKEDWLSIAEMPSHEGRYVFAYMLTNQCSFSYRQLCRWARARDLKVIYVKGNTGVRSEYEDDGAEVTAATIPQWLGYVANAAYVVTNSFHCSVFSVIFGRRLGVIPLDGQAGAANNRVKDMCDSTGGVCKWLSGNDYDSLDQVMPNEAVNCPSGGTFIRRLFR